MRAGAGAVGDVDGIREAASGRALRSRSSASQATGGVISAVMTNCRARSSFPGAKPVAAAWHSSLVRGVGRGRRGSGAMRGWRKPPI